MTKRTPEQIVYDCINNIDPTECVRCESVDLSVTITETTFESSDGRILPGNKKKEIRCNTCKNLLQTGPFLDKKPSIMPKKYYDMYMAHMKSHPEELKSEILNFAEIVSSYINEIAGWMEKYPKAKKLPVKFHDHICAIRNIWLRMKDLDSASESNWPLIFKDIQRIEKITPDKLTHKLIPRKVENV